MPATAYTRRRRLPLKLEGYGEESTVVIPQKTLIAIYQRQWRSVAELKVVLALLMAQYQDRKAANEPVAVGYRRIAKAVKLPDFSVWRILNRLAAQELIEVVRGDHERASNYRINETNLLTELCEHPCSQNGVSTPRSHGCVTTQEEEDPEGLEEAKNESCSNDQLPAPSEGADSPNEANQGVLEAPLGRYGRRRYLQKAGNAYGIDPFNVDAVDRVVALLPEDLAVDEFFRRLEPTLDDMKGRGAAVYSWSAPSIWMASQDIVHHWRKDQPSSGFAAGLVATLRAQDPDAYLVRQRGVAAKSADFESEVSEAA